MSRTSNVKPLRNECSVISAFRSYPSPVQNGGPNGTTTMSCASSQGEHARGLTFLPSLPALVRGNSTNNPANSARRNARYI